MTRTERSLERGGAPVPDSVSTNAPTGGVDLDAILHPARVFAHPREVVNHPGLSPQEKRAILSSWAYDACAFDYAELSSGTNAPVRFDEIMEALRSIEAEPVADPPPGPRPRRTFALNGFWPRSGCLSRGSRQVDAR